MTELNDLRDIDNDIQEYQHYEKMLGLRPNPLVQSAPNQSSQKQLRDSEEVQEIIRETLRDFVPKQKFLKLEDKYYQKIDDNRVLLDRIRNLEKDFK